MYVTRELMRKYQNHELKSHWGRSGCDRMIVGFTTTYDVESSIPTQDD